MSIEKEGYCLPRCVFLVFSVNKLIQGHGIHERVAPFLFPCRALTAVQLLLRGIETRASTNAVPCISDPSLPQIPEGKRFFIASNLHNNEQLLPHFTLQLLSLLQQLPKGSTYVSIYESGSTDRTGVHTCSHDCWLFFGVTRSSAQADFFDNRVRSTPPDTTAILHLQGLT